VTVTHHTTSYDISYTSYDIKLSHVSLTFTVAMSDDDVSVVLLGGL